MRSSRRWQLTAVFLLGKFHGQIEPEWTEEPGGQRRHVAKLVRTLEHAHNTCVLILPERWLRHSLQLPSTADCLPGPAVKAVLSEFFQG